MGRDLAQVAAPMTSWRAAQSSVRGRSHVTDDLPNQDAVAVGELHGVTAVVVCDGAGSCPHAHHGARAVAQHLAHYLAGMAHTAGLRWIRRRAVLAEARAAIEEQRQRHGGVVEDYACTLLAVVIKGDDVVVAHLGDGLVAEIRGDEAVLLSDPDNGSAARFTYFVTCPTAVDRLRLLRFRRHPRVTGFLLGTDGAQPAILDEQTREVSSVAAEIAGWLDQGTRKDVSAAIARTIKDHFQCRTADDCTLAVLLRDPGSARTGGA